MDDAALVRQALRQDREAFAELVRRHEPALRRACLRVTGGDDALAADAVQDAILQALVGLDELRAPDAFGAWLTGIGLYRARRAMTLRPAGPAALESLAAQAPGPAEAAERAVVAARVHAAIEALPSGQRAAVRLYHIGDLSQAEVAELLGTAEGAVRQRLHKARTALRRDLHDLQPEGAPPQMPSTDPVPMRVIDVRPSSSTAWSATHVVELAEIGGDDRRLPIWVDTPEAQALTVALEDIELPRPGTYVLTASLLAAAGRRVAEVRVNRLDQNIFYAEIHLDDGASVDARPSDALNLALRTGAPISVDSAVLEQATEPTPDGPPGAPAIADEIRARLADRKPHT